MRRQTYPFAYELIKKDDRLYRVTFSSGDFYRLFVNRLNMLFVEFAGQAVEKQLSESGHGNEETDLCVLAAVKKLRFVENAINGPFDALLVQINDMSCFSGFVTSDISVFNESIPVCEMVIVHAYKTQEIK